jgi:hypothetical protein
MKESTAGAGIYLALRSSALFDSRPRSVNGRPQYLPRQLYHLNCPPPGAADEFPDDGQRNEPEDAERAVDQPPT